MASPALFVGMDLGTFKTSVAASNGQRTVVQTIVGWARDHVARAALGRDVLFGKEAVEQRLAVDLVRPFAKGALKYGDHTEFASHPEQFERQKEAARRVVEHAVSLINPDNVRPIYGVIGAPSRASVVNKQLLLDIAGAVFDQVMIVPEPFTVAYAMDLLVDTLVIDVGAGTTDICPIYGTFPSEQYQVTVPVGGDAIDEKFYAAVLDSLSDVRLTLNMAREIKEKFGFVHDTGDRALVTLPTPDGQRREFDLTAPLREACRSIVAPIVKGVRETIQRFDPEFQSRLVRTVLLGGGGSQLRGLDRVIERELAEFGVGQVTRTFDPVYSGAMGALKLAMAMPADYWQRLSAATAPALRQAA